MEIREFACEEGAKHLSVVCADGRFLLGLEATISVIISTRPHPICSRVFVHLRTDGPSLSASGRRLQKLPDCSNHTRTPASVLPERRLNTHISQVPGVKVELAFWFGSEEP